jgi:hypothetical protein
MGTCQPPPLPPAQAIFAGDCGDFRRLLTKGAALVRAGLWLAMRRTKCYR